MAGTLVEAIRIAVDAHGETTDKQGQPYILHPLRVMMAQESEVARIVGVLHDVVEDTEVTAEDLREAGFSEEVLTALALVTHDDGSPYLEYVERLQPNPIARAVKLADLEDNMRVQRLPGFTERDMKRMKKYLKAWRFLRGEAGL